MFERQAVEYAAFTVKGNDPEDDDLRALLAAAYKAGANEGYRTGYAAGGGK